MPSLQNYINSTRNAKQNPKDPYSHAAYVLSTDQEAVSEFYQLISNDLKLAFINDDRLLRLYQNDITYLVNLFIMARRDPDVMKEVFLALYYGWLGALALTRAKNGTERKLQAAAGQSAYAPKDTLQGLGVSIPQIEPEQQRGNILSRILPQRNQQ